MPRVVLLTCLLGLGIALASQGRAPSVKRTASRTPVPIPAKGLHNVYQLTPNVFSGSSPEGNDGFESLQLLGIRTVITVDGALPEVDHASMYGMRYVHLPIGYDGVPRDTGLRIAKAIRDLPGPVYVHCHHGKHRGPAAAACALLALDSEFSADDARMWMRVAGTDPRYKGLVTMPETFQRPLPTEIDSLSSQFPSLSPPSNLVQVMIRVDERWDRIKAWQASKSVTQPPLAEVVNLGEEYRELARHPDVIRKGEGFAALLREAESAARILEDGWRRSDAATAQSGFQRSQAVCSKCHAKHRD